MRVSDLTPTRGARYNEMAARRNRTFPRYGFTARPFPTKAWEKRLILISRECYRPSGKSILRMAKFLWGSEWKATKSFPGPCRQHFNDDVANLMNEVLQHRWFVNKPLRTHQLGPVLVLGVFG